MSFAQPFATVLDLDPAPGAFSEYHKEFASLLSASTASIAAARSVTDPSPDAAAAALDDADRDLGEAVDLLKSMELEAQAQEGDTRIVLRKHVVAGREALSGVRNELRVARIGVAQRRDDTNRADLFNGSASADPPHHIAQLAGTTDQLAKGSELITDSRRHIAESEFVGAAILEDLQSQRNTIARARQNLGGVGSGLEESNAILSTMRRRALMNKIIVYAVLAGIGFACIGIIYIRVFHRARKD